MKEIKGAWLVLSGFIGIILGTLFVNGMERLAPEALTVFAIDQYSISDWLIQERRDLGWHLFRQRGGQILGVLIVGCLCNSVLLIFLLTGFGGFIWGLFLSLETMRMGIQGLLLAVACFLPQGICYVLAIWLFLSGKEQMRHQKGMTIQAAARSFLLPIGVAVFGVLSEIWISPELLYWIIQ